MVMNGKFKVRDKVRIVDRRHGDSSSRVARAFNGELGTIISCQNEYCILDIGTTGIYYDELDLIVPEWEE